MVESGHKPESNVFQAEILELGSIDIQDNDETEEKPHQDSLRENRLRRAFEQSKLSYQSERIFTEPGWYFDLSDSDGAWPEKLHAKNTDYTLNGLYFSGKYEEALHLALKELKGTSDFGDDAQAGRRRELHDLAMRCAIHTNNGEKASQIADWTKKKWSTSPGLAATAAEAYLLSSRPRDALSAILISAIASRDILLPSASLLARCLQNLQNHTHTPEAHDAIQRMLELINPYIRTFNPLFIHTNHRDLNDRDTQFQAQENHVGQRPRLPGIKAARSWVDACGIGGIDGDRLIAILCKDSSTQEDEELEGRSVRVL